MNLVLIESPNKIHTLQTILGSQYQILATVGHIMKIADSGSYKTGIDIRTLFHMIKSL